MPCWLWACCSRSHAVTNGDLHVPQVILVGSVFDAMSLVSSVADFNFSMSGLTSEPSSVESASAGDVTEDWDKDKDGRGDLSGRSSGVPLRCAIGADILVRRLVVMTEDTGSWCPSSSSYSFSSNGSTFSLLHRFILCCINFNISLNKKSLWQSPQVR
jgi:hypothetical protein